ncbi:MAG: hypothetical protein AAFS10_16955, partial [Myxococcota bacterium]
MAVVLGVGLVAGIALEWARWHSEQMIGARLRDEAAAQGWRVGWERLVLHRDLTLAVTGLEATQGSTRVAVERMEAGWRWTDLKEGRRVPRWVRMAGVDAVWANPGGSWVDMVRSSLGEDV